MPQRFRLVTWNIERGIKFENILAILCEKIPADIYAFQEVDIYAYRSRYRNVAADLASGLRMPYVFGAEFRELAQEGRGSAHALHGQEFISRFPIINWETFYFPNQFKDWTPRWFHKPLILSRLPRLQTKLIQNVGSVELGHTVAHFFQPREGGRMALFGEFKVGDRKLFIYNTHLESHASDAQKALQMQDIIQNANSKLAESDAVIIIGDLNTNLGKNSPVIKLAHKHNFVDVLLNCKKKNIATCDTNKRLDWILTKNLKVVEGSVWLDAFNASDHRPVMAELEFL